MRERLRLNQILSSAGLTSRRKADEWIKRGRVVVNGQVVTEPGTRALWGQDQIQVDGRPVPGPPEKVYLLLNKPFGYICALSDPQGRPVVIDLLKGVSQRVYPVGRLDFDTLGLLLLTNDGEWAHRFTHPRYRVPRTYKATVRGNMDDDAIHFLRKGISLGRVKTLTAKVVVVSRNQKETLLRITITEGRSRQVRRMVESVGYRVVHLIRTSFGRVALGDLKVGACRHLTREEVQSMKRLVGMD